MVRSPRDDHPSSASDPGRSCKNAGVVMESVSRLAAEGHALSASTSDTAKSGTRYGRTASKRRVTKSHLSAIIRFTHSTAVIVPLPLQVPKLHPPEQMHIPLPGP